MHKILAAVVMVFFCLAGDAHAVSSDAVSSNVVSSEAVTTDAASPEAASTSAVSDATQNSGDIANTAGQKIGFLQGTFHAIRANSEENLSSSRDVVVPDANTSPFEKLALPLFTLALIGAVYFFRRKGGYPAE